MAGYVSFVVRFRKDERRGITIGQITHVGSQASLRFTEMASMVRFIRDCLESQADADRAPGPGGAGARSSHDTATAAEPLIRDWDGEYGSAL